MNDNVAAVNQTQMKKMGSLFYEQSKHSHPTNHLFFNEIIIICVMKSVIWAGEIDISLMDRVNSSNLTLGSDLTHFCICYYM